MVKAVGHILLALLLFISTTGITVSQHFCGDDLKSLSILTAPESCCDIPGGCCHNKTIVVDIEDEFTTSLFAYYFEQLAISQPFNLLYAIDEPQQNNHWVSYYKTPPPPLIQVVLSSLQAYLL